VLAAIDWRAVFWVNVPVGVFGTVWAYHKLRDTGERHPGRIDWWGNITFAVGLSAIPIGVTNGIKPYGDHAMGWTNPAVIGSIVGGLALLVLFVLIEKRLLVMDYQNGIVDMLGEPEELLSRAADAIALIRRHGGQIGYVRVAFENADFDAIPPTSRMGQRVGTSPQAFHNDSPGTAIHDRVAPEDGDIIVRKVRVGAFSTTDLDARLRDRGIDTLILSGISSSGVVLSTVRDASDRDYRVLVLADATADPDPEVHAFLTERIFPRQADVIAVADLEGLLRRSDPD